MSESGTAAVAAPSPEARRALLGSAVGYAMDGFDLLILGFMLRRIGADLGLSPPEAASLVTATLAGAVIGGLVFGALSDRLGRVRVLSWTIVVFAVFTGLCALAQGYWDLLVYRTIAGTGLGGEFGIGINIGRAVGGFGPVAITTVAVGHGFETAIALLAVLYVVDMLAMWWLIPERRGVELT